MEFKPKNRDWVKNASIIFLSFLLVLTFFSNTWMNRSLPEVATQYVTNGTITAKVRGTGTVSAVGVTSVKADATREIRAVMVKVGQEVKAGDVLFVLGQGEASELETAQEKLRQLQLNYQRTAVGILQPDYSLDEKRIADARQAVEEARVAKEQATAAAAKANGYSNIPLNQRDLANEEVSYDAAMLQAAKDDLAAAKVELETARLAYDNSVTAIREKYAAQKEMALAPYNEAEAAVLVKTGERNAAAQSYLEAKANYDDLVRRQQEQKARIDQGIPLDEGEEPITDEMVQAAKQASDSAQVLAEQAEAALLAAVNDRDEKLAAANEARDKLDQDEAAEQEAADGVFRPKIDAGEARVKELEKAVEEAEETLRVATEKRDAIQATIDEILGQSGISSELKAANDAYKAAQDRLYELEYDLQQRRVSDSQSQSLDYLSLSDISAQIELAKKKVAELSGGEENQVIAKSAGTVETINCAPGDTKLKGDLLCTIEVPDLGYTMSFSVTNDQARRLKPGDTATVSNYYWGNQITATLESIKADPKNPQTKKILNFDVTGDVAPGTELTISVGQKSANYDLVVPNNSIRSDTNGSFVLVVESKSSPLGNRYIAHRVNVSVLAEDDVNSAVTGDLNSGDYVITTSNVPVKNGDLVRLADNA